MTLEICCACEGPTGRAGKGEDSLYALDDGPYCENCWYDLPIEYAEELLAKEADRLVLRDRTDTIPALLAAEREKALREAAEIAFEADDCYLARNGILALIVAETAPQPDLSGTSEPQAATATGADGYDQFWGALDDVAPRNDPVAQAIKALRSAWLVRDLTENDFRRACIRVEFEEGEGL